MKKIVCIVGLIASGAVNAQYCREPFKPSMSVCRSCSPMERQADAQEFMAQVQQYQMERQQYEQCIYSTAERQYSQLDVVDIANQQMRDYREAFPVAPSRSWIDLMTERNCYTDARGIMHCN